MRFNKENGFLLVIGLLLIALIVRDFSYTTKVERSYYSILYVEEGQRLQELESGTIQMTGTMTHSSRYGRRIKGTFRIDGRTGQVSFATHANYYDRKLKWYNALLTADEIDFAPVEMAGYTSSTLCFARNLSAIGLLLEDGDSRFYLIAAAEKEGIPEAETAVWKSVQGG